MKITLLLSSLNNDMKPLTSIVDNSGRITEKVADASRKLLKYGSVKKPVMSLMIDNTLVQEYEFKQGGDYLAKFKKLNFDIMKEILASRYTSEEMVYDKSTKDNEALKIAKVFGFKGTAVSIGDALANINGVEKGVKLRAKYQKEHAGKVAGTIAGYEIMQLEAAAKEQRKIASDQKKADKLALTQAAEKLLLIQAKAKPKAKRKKKEVVVENTTA